MPIYKSPLEQAQALQNYKIHRVGAERYLRILDTLKKQKGWEVDKKIDYAPYHGYSVNIKTPNSMEFDWLDMYSQPTDDWESVKELFKQGFHGEGMGFGGR